MMTKKIYAAALCAMAVSCNVQDIPDYRPEDSSVNFESSTVAFSVRGIEEEEISVTVNLELVGVVTDYDRPVTVLVEDNARNTAVENEDFRIDNAVVRAGATNGEINMTVRKLPIDVSEMTTTFYIVPNEYFRTGMKGQQSAVVTWSASYVRPAVGAWRSWWYFFSHGYSRAFHEVLIQAVGENVETSTHMQSEASANPDLTFRMVSWWYSAASRLREYVSEYDEAHPDAPLMHSADYEEYSSYLVAVGNGTKPDTIPTIYETLL